MAVVVVGAAHWDVIARASVVPGPGADLPGRVRRRVGGVAANLALALADRGRAVELRTALGADPDGAALRAALAARGVSLATITAPRTDAYVVLEGPDGEVVAAVADCEGIEAAGSGLVAGLDPGAEAVLADGNLASAVLAGLAALRPLRLVLVPASPAKAPRLAPVLAGAQLVANRREAEALAGRAFPDSAAAAEALRGLGAAEALVTDGAAAATTAGPWGLLRRDPPAVAARSLTGAGDVLAAAHLDSRLAGADPGAALAAALDAAARHITEDRP